MEYPRAGDLVQHATECFGVPYRNSKKFLKYVGLHYSGNNYSSQEQGILGTFNTKLSVHSLHQGSYRSKQALRKQQLQKS